MDSQLAKFKSFIALLTILLAANMSPSLLIKNAFSADELQTDIPKSILSYGMAKKYLVVGVTTEADVLRMFGAPGNMTYTSDGKELWIFDQMFSESITTTAVSSAGMTIDGERGSHGGGVSFGVGARTDESGSKQTIEIRTLTVILEFDSKSILLNHSARSGGYK